MAKTEKEQAENQQPVENLTGKDLSIAFNDSVDWLKRVACDPYTSGHYFEHGSVSFSYSESGKIIFNIHRYNEDNSEEYIISPNKGLVLFKREENSKQTTSSILGKLTFEEDFRYFVSNAKREETVRFGTGWLESESSRDHNAKWAMEERKRAAVKITRWCQKQPVRQN